MEMNVYHTYRIKCLKGKNCYMKITDERLEQLLTHCQYSFRRLNPLEYLIDYIWIHVFSYPVLLITDWYWENVKK